jgi:hypothetical protein
MANDEVVINSSIDQIMESLPIGSVTSAIGRNMYGINFRQTGNPVPRPKDQFGFTMFTRPQLNMSTLNLSNYRGFYNLLTNNKLSYQRFTRLILDPRLGYNDGLKSPFVDNTNPFISILTNNITSVSGWPDLSVPVHTSESGLYGEEHSFVDGVTNHFESYDLDISFKNTKGNPLLYLFYIWIKYESLVFEGVLNPYLDMITENEIDYNTRIYRIILDQQKRYVTYIGATGASFPINVPTGNLFDYSVDAPYNTKNSEINIRFRSLGFIAFDDLLKLKFNETVAMFNPQMGKILKHDMTDGDSANKAREDGMVSYRVPGSNYVKLPHYLSMSIDTDIFNGSFYGVNHSAVPYINLFTSELEWWVDSSKFKASSESEFKKNIEASGLGAVNELVD